MSTMFDPSLHKVVWQPHPGKQTKIFESKCQRILAGGGKKSGKTTCALGLALRRIEDPRFKCLIIRQSKTGFEYMLREAQKLFRKVCPEVQYNKTERTFTFPNIVDPDLPGAQVKFWFVKSKEDCDTLEGWGYQLLIVDEARQFADQLLIETLAAECYAEIETDPESPRYGQPWVDTQIILLTNPGGVGGAWLRKMFRIGEYPKGGVVFYDHALQQYLTYIHMTVHDNPSMDADKYIASLRRFPKWKQRQMIDGDWNQAEGSAFGDIITPEHYVKKFDHRNYTIGRSCDYGFATVCSVHWWAIHPDNGSMVCIDELILHKVKSRDIARKILALEAERGYDVEIAVMGRDAWGDGEAGAPAVLMCEEGVDWAMANDAREAGFFAVVNRLTTDVEFHDGSTRKALRFWRERCPELCDTLPFLPLKEGENDIDKNAVKRQRREEGGGYGLDHCYDDTRYMVMAVPLLEADEPEDEFVGGGPRRRGRRYDEPDHEQRGF